MHTIKTMQSAPLEIPDAGVVGRDARTAAVVFTATVFIGSVLLFLVQPMFGKLVLPRLGGSPSVWNTCMLFFQATLLAGYAYAHLSIKWLGTRRQSMVHVLTLLVPVLFLPIALPMGEPSPEHPLRWQLGSMVASVGLPFFAVSTTAPLLQRWFATLPVPSARDPYFLYAASNAGSLLALLGYPLVMEPLIGVREQSVAWAVGYALLVGTTLVCIVLLRRTAHLDPGHAAFAADRHPVATATRASWILLSFVPSSLMLGVTSYITADLAAVPLLWVLPLALYLVTFILAFAQRRTVPARPLAVVMQVLVILSLLTIFVNSHRWTLVPLHLATFFAVALCCHQTLADRRPHVSRLTEFYMWMSVGGVLGGVFNSLVAPQIFTTVFEFPLLLALSPVVVWWFSGGPALPLRTVGAGMGAAAACLAAGALWFAEWPSETISGVLLALAVGMLARFALAPRAAGGAFVALMLLALIASGYFKSPGTVLFTGRSFFGVHRVVEAPDRSHRLLFHGSTVHGRQELNVEGCPVSSYYFPDGPAGQVMAMTQGRRPSVAVIGLGAGTLACYANEGERWTFYEIDPMVDYLATRSGMLTQVAASPGAISVVLGDGRLKIQAAPPASYDLLVADSFSSDSIPMHLVTREAVRLYMSRLQPDGLLLMNISNRYVDVEPVLAAIARLEHLAIRSRFDGQISPADARRGRTMSDWVVMARDEKLLQPLDQLGWQTPQIRPDVPAWTDDYSNLLDALRFR